MPTILLIEDDQDVRETTADILEFSDFKVFQAETGEEGIKLAKRESPDLILCDIMMPGQDGYEVFSILSQDPKTYTIPFIFLTALAEKEEIRYGINLGADDYITKPFEEEELLKIIQKRLNRTQGLKGKEGDSLEGFTQFVAQAEGFEELKGLVKDYRVRTFEPEETLFRQDESAEFLFLINSGKVRTLKKEKGKGEIVTGEFSQGNYLGHLSLLQDQNFRETAVVVERAQICKVPKQDFITLIHKNPEVSAHFIKLLSGAIAEKEEQLLAQAFDSRYRKLARLLLDLHTQSGKNREAHPVIDLDRHDLAIMLEIPQETLMRSLHAFRQQKLIEMEAKKVRLMDLEALERISASLSTAGKPES